MLLRVCLNCFASPLVESTKERILAVSSCITASSKHDAVSTILAALPEEEHDRLIPLMSEAPRLVARLIPGRRAPHKSALFRHATQGVQGIVLRTVTCGRTRLTCARWVAQHWLAVAEAKLAPKRRRRTGGAR